MRRITTADFSRRQMLKGTGVVLASGLLSGVGCASNRSEGAVENSLLRDWLDKPVSALVELEPISLSAGQQQRDRVYLHLLMALIYHYRNGNKEGKAGRYPYNEIQEPESFKAGDSDGEHLGADYLGHNIAALAVDGDGRIIDFDFNHNELLDSTVEHAESRLIRRVYSLAQIHDTWNVAAQEANRSRKAARDDDPSFDNVTIYTSLEPCAQCAGIMALSHVWRVVYLQSDPGVMLIGNILHNLDDSAPLPVSADNVRLNYFEELNAAFEEFQEQVEKEEPFSVPKGPNEEPVRSTSVTSFLCTKIAQDIFGRGAKEFRGLVNNGGSVDVPEFRPQDSKGKELPDALTNLEILEEVKGFHEYATTKVRRGTPHRL